MHSMCSAATQWMQLQWLCWNATKGQEVITGHVKKKKSSELLKQQLLTPSPLLPGVPCGPGRPRSPFSPCSPGGPIRPINPGWPCGMKTNTSIPILKLWQEHSSNHLLSDHLNKNEQRLCWNAARPTSSRKQRSISNKINRFKMKWPHVAALKRLGLPHVSVWMCRLNIPYRLGFTFSLKSCRFVPGQNVSQKRGLWSMKPAEPL